MSPRRTAKGSSRQSEPAVQPAAFGIVDAARYVGVSRSTIIVEIGSGRLPSAKVGRRRLLRVVDLDAWLADRVAAAE